MVRIADLASGPYWKHMNMTAETLPDGRVQVVMKITDELLQFYGNIHGGVIAGLMDSCIAVAIHLQLDANQGAKTIEIKVNYLQPAKEGKIIGIGKVVHQGRRIIVGAGEIRAGSDKLIAFGTATFKITNL